VTVFRDDFNHFDHSHYKIEVDATGGGVRIKISEIVTCSKWRAHADQAITNILIIFFINMHILLIR
jgi:hypothetical protein